MNAFAPNETVMPVIVTEILIGFEFSLRFRRIVATGNSVRTDWRGKDRRAGLQIERNETLEMNGVAGIGTRGEQHSSTTCGSRRGDRLVNRRTIDGSTVTLGSEATYVEDVSNA